MTRGEIVATAQSVQSPWCVAIGAHDTNPTRAEDSARTAPQSPVVVPTATPCPASFPAVHESAHSAADTKSSAVRLTPAATFATEPETLPSTSPPDALADDGLEFESFATSMIVHNFHTLCPGFSPKKTDSELTINPDRMLAAAISLQNLKPISWRHTQSFNSCRRVQLVELAPGDVPNITGAATASCLALNAIKNILCALIQKGNNHICNYNG